MLLVIDVGNTNMVLGIFEGAELKGSFRLMTDANRTSDEVGLMMCQYFQRFGVALDQVEDVVIGSVVPQVMHTLSNAVRKYLGKVPLVIDEDLDPRLPYIPCDSDERLGPDRAVADIAAIEKEMKKKGKIAFSSSVNETHEVNEDEPESLEEVLAGIDSGYYDDSLQQYK